MQRALTRMLDHIREPLENYSICLTVTGMASRRTILDALLRSLAAATLLLWMASILVCTVHCAGLQSQPGCCHKKSSSNPQENAFCLRSQTIAIAPLAVEIGALDFGVQPFLISQFQNLSPQHEPKSTFFFQPFRSDFVLTPEVCLGPAFRSLAPPRSSLS